MDLFCPLIDIPTIHRTTETTTSIAKPFPRAVRVTSTSSFAGTLLLNKKAMFQLKLPKFPGALKLL